MNRSSDLEVTDLGAVESDHPRSRLEFAERDRDVEWLQHLGTKDIGFGDRRQPDGNGVAVIFEFPRCLVTRSREVAGYVKGNLHRETLHEKYVGGLNENRAGVIRYLYRSGRGCCGGSGVDRLVGAAATG